MGVLKQLQNNILKTVFRVETAFVSDKNVLLEIQSSLDPPTLELKDLMLLA